MTSKLQRQAKCCPRCRRQLGQPLERTSMPLPPAALPYCRSPVIRCMHPTQRMRRLQRCRVGPGLASSGHAGAAACSGAEAALKAAAGLLGRHMRIAGRESRADRRVDTGGRRELPNAGGWWETWVLRSSISQASGRASLDEDFAQLPPRDCCSAGAQNGAFWALA